jgi:CubicO group peptidase (beta-lactamase class C family)
MKPHWSARAALVWLALVVSFAALAQSAPPLPQASPESVGMSSQRLAKINAALKKEVADGSFRGAVVMVARKGKLVYQDAVGMQAADAPMRQDSVFRIYSMTKPLVSVAAMMLVEDGRLQLTDPVGKFLAGFDKMQVSIASKTAEGTAYTTVAAERPMTVQDLLRHTSGLAYGEITQNAPVKDGLERAGLYRKDLDYEARGVTPSEQVEKLAAVPLAFHPGTTWHYSLSSDVLGRVVEAASGKRLGEFLQERLFRPLKMRDTAFSVPQAKLARLAEPLETDRFSGRPNRLIDVSAPPKNDSGGAGAISTAGDYLRFSQMLLNGGALEGSRVMSRTTVRLMTSDHLGTFINQPVQPGELLLGTKGYSFGLGFAVRQADGVGGVPGSAGEFMWAGYAGTYFFVDPKESLTAVLMTQAPSPNRAYFRKMLKQLVYQSIVD